MKRFTVVFGVVLAIVALAPLVGEAQERVKAFDRLNGPRGSRCRTIREERAR